MTKQIIDLGLSPTGAGGDTPRSAFSKVQNNFDELYATISAAQSNFDELYKAISAAHSNLDKITAATGGATNLPGLLATLQGAGAFGKSNILGTVSQQSEVPTGAVIERGSNSNGQYVRFADGTQICWGSSPGAIANNAASDGLFFSGMITVGFPVAFSSTPVLSASSIDQTSAMSWVGYPASYSETIGYFSLISFSNGATATLQWMAIGRWY